MYTIRQPEIRCEEKYLEGVVYEEKSALFGLITWTVRHVLKRDILGVVAQVIVPDVTELDALQITDLKGYTAVFKLNLKD